MGMYLNKKITLLTNNAKPSVREVIINMIIDQLVCIIQS